MNHALMNWTAHAETMTGTALILLVVLGKAIQSLSKRLSKSRLTLTTDSFALTMQTKPDLLPQESPPHVQGGNDNGRRDDDDRGIPGVNPRHAGENAFRGTCTYPGAAQEAQRQEESQAKASSDRSQPQVENQKW